ncbi:MAG TPA: 50S ribosome-binding GTPase, partial [Candidatus Megaira endosymbiont of Hartmannula sinica]|nr:50S ribosome-binding GTPase [Candidatus Megaera endosymbiont of Hartmannula sinica]
MQQNKQKFLSATIIGKPNSGKSTLTNRLIKEDLSIITPKVQTTRTIITGIITIKDTQLVLLDTPGIFNPKTSLEKAMVKCAYSSIRESMLVIFIIDSSRKITDDIKKIINNVLSVNKEIVFILNKIDLHTTSTITH